MTVLSSVNRFDFVGNGSQTAFPMTNCLVLASGDVQVYQAGVLKTITTHYTLSGIGSPSGTTVTFLVAPANGEDVLCLRVVVATQGVDYVANDAFPAETHEQALDRLTMLSQQYLEEVGRALKFKTTSLLSNKTLDDLVAGRVAGVKQDLSGIEWLDKNSLNSTLTEQNLLAGYLLASPPPNTVGILSRITDGRNPQSPVIGDGSNVRSVYSRNAAVIVVTDPQFGAKGDGTTNDTVAIQAAIDAANAYAGGGAVVWFPPGIYRVGALTWKQGVPLIGSGVDITILKSNAASVMLTYSSGSVVHVNGIIRDLTLHGNSQGTKALSLTNLARFYMDRVLITSFMTKGIETIGSLVFQVYRSQILASVIGVDGTSSAQAAANLVAFRDTVINGHSTYGVQWANGGLFIMDGCDVESNGTAANAATGGVKLTGMTDTGEGVAAVIDKTWFEANNGHSSLRINVPDFGAIFIVRDSLSISGTRTYGFYAEGAGTRILWDGLSSQNSGTADFFTDANVRGAIRECRGTTKSIGNNDVQLWPDPTAPDNWVYNADGTYIFRAGGATGYTFNVAGSQKVQIRSTGVEIGTGAAVTPISAHLTATAALDFGSIAANTSAELTIAVTGAVTGDSVTVTPNGAPESGLVWSGHAGTNIVTVRLGNVTTGAIDPASRTWRADVWKH